MHLSYLEPASCDLIFPFLSSSFTTGSGSRLNCDCSFWVSPRLRNSHLGAGRTDGCDIFVYWYGRKHSISHASAKDLPGQNKDWRSPCAATKTWNIQMNKYVLKKKRRRRRSRPQGERWSCMKSAGPQGGQGSGDHADGQGQSKGTKQIR